MNTKLDKDQLNRIGLAAIGARVFDDNLQPDPEKDNLEAEMKVYKSLGDNGFAICETQFMAKKIMTAWPGVLSCTLSDGKFKLSKKTSE